jgi:hypothetical protein
MSELPPEAERLLSTRPEEFVAERGRLVKELRAADRRDEAAAAAAMRKPPPVVFAVNRAARDRPQVATDAAEAAQRVLETQLSGESGAYREATKALDRALDLLAEVALAHVAPGGKPASDATSRRVRDLLRAAVADEDARRALARGVLAEEPEASGFTAFAGAVRSPPAPRRVAPRRKGQAAKAAAARRAREKKLRAELARAEESLRAAERSLEEARRSHDRAEKVVAALRAKLDSL